jgi:outer membrane protein assembly factor BamB
MTRPRRPLAVALPAAVALVIGLTACSGDSNESSPPAPQAPPPPPETEPAPPPPPEVTIRVLDGDTSEPVDGARVSVGGQAAETSADGAARLTGSKRRAARVRVSAHGYAPRTVRVDMRDDATRKIAVWRPDLQWPMYGANPKRTQVHPEIELRPPFRQVWHRKVYGLLEFPAVVWEGVAYVNTMKGLARAISMKSGRVLWKRRVGSLMAASPAVDPARGALVVTTMVPGGVSVLDLDSGRVRWRFPIGARVEPSPVIRNGVAYLGAENGSVYALDLDRRRPKWVFSGGAKITGSPALAGNRLYVGDYAGRVFALNARTGRRIWTGSAGSRVYGTTAVEGGRVFAPSVFSGLSALSARTGRLLWRVPVGSYVYSSPAVYRGRVYFGTHGGAVYSVDARSGRVLWARSADGRVSGAVQIVSGIVYAASLEDSISAWNWRTGKQVWSFPHGEYVPVSGNGARLLIHGRSELWAVEPRRGR